MTSKDYKSYIYILILSLLQSFYFLGSQKDPLHTKIFFAITTFLIFIFLGNFSKKLLNIFIIFSFLVTCVVFPTIKIYGTIDYSLINSVFYSNKISGVSYLKVLNSGILIPLFLLAIFSFFLVRRNMIFRLGNKFKIISLVILIFFPIRRGLINSNPDLYKYLYILPVNKGVENQSLLFRGKRR